MPIPTVYRTAADAIITFPANDIIRGQSTVKIYAGKTSGSTVASQVNGILTTTQYYSHPLGTTSNSKQRFTLDFGTSQTIEGDAVINIPFSVSGSQTAGRAGLKVGFDISGSNTFGSNVGRFPHRTIVSGSTAEIAALANKDVFPEMTAVKLAFPKTIFKKGDLLQFWYYTFGTRADFNTRVGHDPFARAWKTISGSEVTTEMSLLMPFKLKR